MEHRFGFRQDVKTSIGLRFDPRVILNSQLLQLGQAELEATIETELAENPALERLQDDSETLTDDAILRSIAPGELRPSSSDYEFLRSLPTGCMEEADWLDLAATSDSLADHLRGQLFASLPTRLHLLADYLVAAVNDRGYLGCELEDAALACNSSLESAEEVLRAMHECDPPGVGARTLQECLELQLRGQDSIEGRLARTIVKHHFRDLIDKNVRGLMRRFRVLPDVIHCAFGIIQGLAPYPGEAFSPHRAVQGRPPLRGSVPDLILTFTEAGWLIEVKGADSRSLTINRAYQAKLAELGANAHAPRNEKRHVTEYIGRAQRFMESLDQRKKTLGRIGEYLVQNQAGFVSTGQVEFLRDLTRSKVAADLGVHESTVSRATQDKFVQIANGEVVAFEVFFNQGLRIQKMIAEILATENPRNPLSDESISQLLAERGYQVARRTVHKYRDRNKLLSSRRRKTA